MVAFLFAPPGIVILSNDPEQREGEESKDLWLLFSSPPRNCHPEQRPRAARRGGVEGPVVVFLFAPPGIVILSDDPEQREGEVSKDLWLSFSSHPQELSS